MKELLKGKETEILNGWGEKKVTKILPALMRAFVF